MTEIMTEVLMGFYELILYLYLTHEDKYILTSKYYF